MRIVILGGYGAVGSAAAATLRQAGHEVVTIGRDASRADIALDVVLDKPSFASAVVGANAVVNAAGIEDITVARVACGRGVAFIDISANAGYLSALSLVQGAPVITGVGVAPGITNILADAVHTEAAGTVDIGILLGAGDSHGVAAENWTFGLLGQSFADPESGQRIRNFSRGRRFVLPGGVRRRLLRADFSDQHDMTHVFGSPVTTSFGLDSRFATSTLAAATWFPGSATLARRVHPRGGKDWFVTAVVRGTDTIISATGTGQSEATGVVAAAAAVRSAGLPAKATTLHRIMTLDDVGALPGISIHRGKPV